MNEEWYNDHIRSQSEPDWVSVWLWSKSSHVHVITFVTIIETEL